MVPTTADGLENPTSLAGQGSRADIAGGAYLTNADPNLLTARIAK
ncbi:hypothetical protein ACFV80_45095 [Streptomyces sp. NPDC059862]